MPEGQGMWPALWMLGKNITDVSWPSCGEIDIMEMVGGGSGQRQPSLRHCSLDNARTNNKMLAIRPLIMVEISYFQVRKL